MKRLWQFTFAAFAAGLACAGVPSKGFAVFEEGGNFRPYAFTRRDVGEDDIEIKTLYAGICHSDLHNVAADWGPQEYPMVPGHEILGQVVRVGKNVTKFKVGDYAGIGCLVDSCRVCDWCKRGLEQYCARRVPTYHGHDASHGGVATQGGYSDNYVLNADFAIKVPATADLERVAPLLCAGITTYSPIRFAGVRAGDKAAVAGFGGLGHMALRYLVALGAEVTVFDVSEGKRGDALRLGAKAYVNVGDAEAMRRHANAFDFILSTIPRRYDMATYLRMLKIGGKLGVVGIPAAREMPALKASDFVSAAHRHVFGSVIGGIPETQEMLDYSVAHGIYPEVELIPPKGEVIDRAYKAVAEGKVRFRYVIDMREMASPQPEVTLNNGLRMPQFGLGTFAQGSDDICRRSVELALRNGYRHIDTAHAYNDERGVGQGIEASGVPRGEIWVTSKLWPSEYGEGKTAAAIDAMLERLGLEYIDCVYLHQPVGDVLGAWKELEAAVRAGKVRTLGISNFERVEGMVERLWAAAEIKPAVYQLECHPYAQRTETRRKFDALGMKAEAWFPLGHGNPTLLADPVFVEIGKAHGKTAAQVILRWHIQEGITVIPGATREDHIKENVAIFDFALTEDEMARIRALNKERPFFTPPRDLEKAYLNGSFLRE